MPSAIALIMLGIGINLTFRDFLRVFVKPRAIITGLICQLILLPLIAFLLVWWWPIEPIFKVGIIIIASAPGGTTSNLVTHLLNGRVALSVSLTSFNSFAVLLTIPFFVNLGLSLFLDNGYDISISLRDTLFNIFFTVVLPVITGVIINEYVRKTNIIKRYTRILLPILLISIVFIALFSGDQNPTNAYLNNLHLIFPLLLLNLLTTSFGFLVARKMKLNHDENYTIAVEMGLQNSALAIFVASQIMNDAHLELVAVMYGSFSFFTTIIIAWFLKNHTNIQHT